MDFGLRSSRNHLYNNPEAAGWSDSDITSFLIKRQRGSNFGITLQGFVVRPAPARTDFHAAYADNIAFDEDVLREIFATATTVPVPELRDGDAKAQTDAGGGLGEFDFHFDTEVDLDALMESFAPTEQPSISISMPDELNLSPSPGTSSSPASDARDRHACSVCRAAFKRPSDLRRHSRVHSPETRTFHCREPHCGRNGERGFYRRDKLVQHQRQVHGVVVC